MMVVREVGKLKSMIACGEMGECVMNAVVCWEKGAHRKESEKVRNNGITQRHKV